MNAYPWNTRSWTSDASERPWAMWVRTTHNGLDTFVSQSGRFVIHETPNVMSGRWKLRDLLQGRCRTFQVGELAYARRLAEHAEQESST